MKKMILLIAGMFLFSAAYAAENTLRIYLAAGMNPVFDLLKEEFKKETGITIDVDSAGSGVLITRAREDKDADLFIPADGWYLDQLNEKTGLIESKSTIAYFVPVIIVQKGNPKKVAGLQDFLRDDIIVGLGREEACTIGKKSTELFKKNDIDRKKIRNAKESFTVNELGVWVEMKNVDAAIVWDAIAENFSKGVEVIRIPKDKNLVTEVVAGIMKTSKNKASAQKFIDFLKSEKGKKILKDKGYRTEAP